MFLQRDARSLDPAHCQRTIPKELASTLLVGVSGVGKTEILKAIRTLKRIARRSETPVSAWGVAWKVRFTTSGNNYLWEGENEGRQATDEPGVDNGDPRGLNEDDLSTGPKVVCERLCVDDEVVIDRNRTTIHFKQQPNYTRADTPDTVGTNSSYLITYTKRNPGHATHEPYYRQLRSRIDDCRDHLRTLQTFLTLCDNIHLLTADGS